jgi:hypothetical protein
VAVSLDADFVKAELLYFEVAQPSRHSHEGYSDPKPGPSDDGRKIDTVTVLHGVLLCLNYIFAPL